MLRAGAEKKSEMHYCYGFPNYDMLCTLWDARRDSTRYIFYLAVKQNVADFDFRFGVFQEI